MGTAYDEAVSFALVVSRRSDTGSGGQRADGGR